MAEWRPLFDDAAFEKLAERLRNGAPDTPEWLLLRAEAEKIGLSPGFEKLVSLQCNRIEEYPHQTDAALRALRDMRGRAILADEVGLGKTIEAGIIIKELIVRGLARRILILTPAPLTLQWQEEMREKFDEEFAVCSSSDGWDGERVIASLDMAKRPEHAERIAEFSYDLLIVDEAHRLRNRSSQVWRLVNGVTRKYVLLLTATPVHNELAELYSLVTLVKPGQLKTYRAFRERFVDPSNPRNPIHGAELKSLLSEVMIRNRRANVAVKLPPRSAYTYAVKLSEKERELYDGVAGLIRDRQADPKQTMLLSLLQREVCSSSSAARATLARLAESWEGERGAEYERLQRLVDLAGSIESDAKIDAVRKIVRKAHDKTIVFTEFLESQRRIVDALKADGHAVVAFNGALSVAEKHEAVRAFRGDVQVMVSTESGGEGRNLQFCNVMVNYDLPWNPMLIEQRIGRIHRLGQTREVYVFNLAARETIEEYVLDLLANKIRMFELVVGELDLILGDVEGEETFEGSLRRIWLTSANDQEIKSRIADFGKRLTDARDRFADIKEAEKIVSRIFE